jgi:hypothetical protein
MGSCSSLKETCIFNKCHEDLPSLERSFLGVVGMLRPWYLRHPPHKPLRRTFLYSRSLDDYNPLNRDLYLHPDVPSDTELAFTPVHTSWVHLRQTLQICIFVCYRRQLHQVLRRHLEIPDLPTSRL